MPHRNLFLVRFNGRNDNLGDQFIFRALVDALRPLGAVQFRGAVPEFSANRQQLPLSDWRLALLAVRSKLSGCSVYSFSPPGGRLWTDVKRRKLSPTRWLRRSLFDLFAGRRIAIGTSVIPAAEHSWCQHYDWVGVRDQASLAALRSAGIGHAEYFPDLAFLSTPNLRSDVPRSKICLSFRAAVPEVEDQHRYAEGLAEATAVLAQTLSADERSAPVFYHQVDEDADFNDRLSSRLGIPRDPARLTLCSFETFYQPARVVISNRLHCLLLGACCGAVPIALTSRGHTKLASLFETLGWQRLVVFVEDVDEIPARFTAIRQEWPGLRAMVEESCDHQRRLGRTLLEQKFGGTRREASAQNGGRGWRDLR